MAGVPTGAPEGGVAVSGRSTVAHLARRWARAVSRREPSDDDVAVVRAVLLPAEMDLWSRLRVEDRRHSIEVLYRFDERAVGAPRAARAAALLHDIGKLESDLGVLARVLATVVGPRGHRFARYHDHERLGVDLLVSTGSDAETVELVAGRGDHAPALADADDI